MIHSVTDISRMIPEMRAPKMSIFRSCQTLPGIDFPADLRKIEPPQLHAARHRIFASRNCSASPGACAEAQCLDSRQLARPDSLRRNTVANYSPLYAGAGTLECAGNLSFRRCFRRNGTPFAGNDSRLRRSRIVRALSLAFYYRSDLPARRLRWFLFLGHQDQSGRDDCVSLGRLARNDANLRFRANLRCQDWIVCRADSTA